MTKGSIIVIAGTDGVGKETQKKILIERLESEGYDLAVFDFPQYGKPSERGVELYLINEEFGPADQIDPYYAGHHFSFDRSYAAPLIQEAVDQGSIVICNRYHTANFGHQGGKLIRHYDNLEKLIKDGERIPELDAYIDWIEDLEFNKYGLPKPDEIVFLHAPVDICQKLKSKQGIRDHMGNLKLDGHERNITHLNFAYFSYLYTAQRKNWSSLDCQDYENPGNLLPIEDIHDRVYEQIQPLLPVMPS